MTIRGGGRPRDPRPVWSPDPRSVYGRRIQRRHGSTLGGLLRFLVFAAVLATIVVAGSLTVLRPIVSDAVVGWAHDNPGGYRIPFIADLVREDLGDTLTDPASRDRSEVVFRVEQGDTVATVARRLEDEGLVADRRAFIFRAMERDLQPKLTIGDFRLTRDMTPDQVVTGLIENKIVAPVVTKVEKIFREALRIDQMAAFIQTWDDVEIDAAAFREIAMDPPDDLLADYPWLKVSGMPDGAPLEGYLFPAAYDLTEDTDAEALIRMMLDRFLAEVGEERVTNPGFYEQLTLASIVEREAQLAEERPLIAGVYQNRLNSEGAGQILNADPTVLYAIDSVALAELPFEDWTQYVFWETPGVPLAEVALPENLERYNTYRNRGLPPTPIAAPGLSSIQAAIDPDISEGYFYFLAIPDGGGAHVFAKTLDEHNENRRRYGYL